MILFIEYNVLSKSYVRSMLGFRDMGGARMGLRPSVAPIGATM